MSGRKLTKLSWVVEAEDCVIEPRLIEKFLLLSDKTRFHIMAMSNIRDPTVRWDSRKPTEREIVSGLSPSEAGIAEEFFGLPRLHRTGIIKIASKARSLGLRPNAKQIEAIFNRVIAESILST